MDFAALGLRVSELGSFPTPPCPCRDARGSVARSEGRGSIAVWKSPVLLSLILPHPFNFYFFYYLVNGLLPWRHQAWLKIANEAELKRGEGPVQKGEGKKQFEPLT